MAVCGLESVTQAVTAEMGSPGKAVDDDDPEGEVAADEPAEVVAPVVVRAVEECSLVLLLKLSCFVEFGPPPVPPPPSLLL